MRRVVVLAALAAGACSPSDPSGAADAATPACSFACLDASSFEGPLSLQVKAELDQVCGQADGCHGAGVGNMSIGPGMEFTQLIGVVSYEMPPMLRVSPGDPLASYVYLKVRCEGGIAGSCMPGGHPDPHTAQIFHDWIEAGAPTQ